MWRVLYDDPYHIENSRGLQIICEDLIEETFAPIRNVEVPNDFVTNLTSDTENEEDIKKAVYFFDNIVKILNKVCEERILSKGYIHSVRSYGTNPIIDKQNDITELYYNSDFDAIREMKNTDYGAFGQTFPHIISASKSKYSYEGNVEFWIWLMNKSVGFNMYMIDENTGKVHDIYRGGFHVLPIVTLASGVLESVEGEGTKENPYILD